MIIALFTDYIPKIPKYLIFRIKDIIKYYKNKEWENFVMFGLFIYLGKFGTGKTCSMVDRAYHLAKKYKHLKILTNFNLYNFPEHTEIIPLTNFNQIVDISGDTLILIDEISSIFNSRNWSKGGIPADLIGLLLQVRKEKKVIFATAQVFKQVDALIRQITFEVVVCNTIGQRWTFQKQYDALDYEKVMDTYDLLPRCLSRSSFLQTEQVRSRYDTYEMIDKAKKQEFLSPEEILNKQGSSIGVQLKEEKKKRLNIL